AADRVPHFGVEVAESVRLGLAEPPVFLFRVEQSYTPCLRQRPREGEGGTATSAGWAVRPGDHGRPPCRPPRADLCRRPTFPRAPRVPTREIPAIEDPRADARHRPGPLG